MRIMLWPRRSWSRSAKYMSKRVLRLTGSPHAVAAGVAAGMMASFTPFMGFHFLIAFGLAFVIGGNMLAAAMGTFIGNPLTFPLIWAATHQAGSYILSGKKSDGTNEEMEHLAGTSIFDVGFSGLFDKIFGLWEPVLKPMLVGSVPLGLTVAIIGYICTRLASSVYNASKLRRREQKLRKRQKGLATQTD